MRANSERSFCVICGHIVTPGTGRFIGTGRVAHAVGTCPKRSPVAKALRRPSKKLLALGNKLFAPCLAIAVVLGAAAAGTGDYVAVLPENGVALGSCAKDLATCEAFRDAVKAGWFPEIVADTPTRCEPKPDCFSARSLCIVGYSC